MTLTFSSEDVRNHLESLGYKNISDRQLKDFVKDLKRLIRYEEKQKRLEKLKTIEEHPKSSVDSTSDEEENIQISNKRQLQRETQVKKTLKHDRQTLHYDQSTGDFSITRDSTSLSYESSSHEKVENKVEVQITHRPNRPLKAFSQKNPEVAQLLPPKPQIPTKPTCSFIRPVIKDPEPKSVKHDPVRLYQFYQDQWKKQRLPGELNRTEKDLRWATREWMMGGPKT